MDQGQVVDTPQTIHATKINSANRESIVEEFYAKNMRKGFGVMSSSEYAYFEGQRVVARVRAETTVSER